MKKFIIILISLISFISCEKEYSTFNNTQTEETSSLGLSNLANYKSVEVSYITIKPENWVTSGEEGSENCYMYAEVEYAFITQKFLDYGVVAAYYVDADNRDNVLPCLVGDSIIRFDITLEKIKFIIQNSDYKNSDYYKNDMIFKIYFIY